VCPKTLWLALPHVSFEGFRAHDGTVSVVAFHPKLPVLLTGSMDHTIKLWDYRTAQLLRTIAGIEGFPRSLAVSPNRRLLAVDGRTFAVRIFELEPVVQ